MRFYSFLLLVSFVFKPSERVFYLHHFLAILQLKLAENLNFFGGNLKEEAQQQSELLIQEI